MAGFSREVSRRIFAGELKGSNLSFRDGEESHQYAPQYLLTPTGAKCNRVFIVGALTERDDIGGDTEYWRGRIVDPTGSILIYAGQYQPEAAQVLSSIEPPAFVAVVGKPSLYETEDGNILLSIRAESIQKVDEPTRDRWILDAARRTLERVEAMESACHLPDQGFTSAADAPKLASVDIEKARMHYNADPGYYRRMVIKALNSLRSEMPLASGSASPQKATDVEVSGADLSGERFGTESSGATASETGGSAPDLADSRDEMPESANPDALKQKPEALKKAKSKFAQGKDASQTALLDKEDVEEIRVFPKKA
jgi:hypothetical protein